MQVPFTHTLLLHPPNNLNREAFYRSWDWGSQKFLAWEHWAEIPVSRFRVLLLNSTALVGKLILVLLGRTRLPRDAYNLMHYPVRKCSVPVLKPFQGLLPFFLRAILLLVTIYFFFFMYDLYSTSQNFYTDTKKSVLSSSLHFIMLNLFSPSYKTKFDIEKFKLRNKYSI